MINIAKYILKFLVFQIYASLIAADQYHPLARQVEFDNQSGNAVQIDWVHPVTKEFVPYGVSDEATRVSLQSFVNHTFALRVVKDLPANRNISLSNNDVYRSSNVTYVTVGDYQEQLIVLKKDLNVEIVSESLNFSRQKYTTAAAAVSSTYLYNSTRETDHILNRCKKEAELASLVVDSSVHGTTVLNDLVECLTRETADVLVIQNEDLAFQRDLRRRIANQAENYTCADPKMVTTKPTEHRTWSYMNEKERPVAILHERSASKIHLISDFLSASECEAIRLAAEPLLHRGTVADGKGGSRMSESRKAWQAGLNTANWKDPKDPIAAVKRRLFAYANDITGFNMSLDGQEDIMSIQYFGNGTNDPTPDRYTPHCDGDCDSMPHKTGGRVATMVMYCDIPSVGGATNFQHANVYVKPTLHAGVFFSYMDNETRVHEEGFTTHSGCPVIEGTKRIAVQWMRVGVDNDNPWDSFDTNTVSKKLKGTLDEDCDDD